MQYVTTMTVCEGIHWHNHFACCSCNFFSLAYSTQSEVWNKEKCHCKLLHIMQPSWHARLWLFVNILSNEIKKIHTDPSWPMEAYVDTQGLWQTPIQTPAWRKVQDGELKSLVPTPVLLWLVGQTDRVPHRHVKSQTLFFWLNYRPPPLAPPQGPGGAPASCSPGRS